jgi:hypothetical protein
MEHLLVLCDYSRYGKFTWKPVMPRRKMIINGRILMKWRQEITFKLSDY